MPNPTTYSKLRGLVLSAVELKSLTDWPEEMIEDYLSIFNSLITLSEEIDNLVDQTAGVIRVTANYAIQPEDGTIFCDTDGGSFTVSLPEGTSGEKHRIINTGSSGNTATITPNGAELLNGVNESEILYDSENFDLQYETDEGWF